MTINMVVISYDYVSASSLYFTHHHLYFSFCASCQHLNFSPTSLFSSPSLTLSSTLSLILSLAFPPYPTPSLSLSRSLALLASTQKECVSLRLLVQYILTNDEVVMATA